MPPSPKNVFTNPEAFARVVVDRHVMCLFLGNCDTKTLDNYVKRGICKKAGTGRFPLLDNCQAVFKRLQEMAAGRLGKDENVDAARANAELKDAQRKLVEARLEQLSGSLISLPEIEQAWAEIALNVKQMLLALPARARFQLPHLTGEDQDKLDELVRDMLTEVAFVTDPPRLPADSKAADDLPAD